MTEYETQADLQTELRIAPRDGVLDIAPYVGGESRIDGANRVVKLSSNENPLGPSASARAAFLEAAGDLALYPDGGHAGLRKVLGEVHRLDADRIVCGNGSDEIIALLCQAYARPGDEVIHTEHGFALYRINALAAGAIPVEVPETERHTDVDAILSAVNERTRIVFIANPNNPTGTLIDDDAVRALAEGLPPQALLVLDGAYAEYVCVPGFDAGARLVAERENVVMTRTFSKIYGLAALRVGWAFAPAAVVDVLNRVRPPFNLSLPALAAAEAAVRDQDHVADCASQTAKWRRWLAAELARSGVPSDHSEGNFLLARFLDPETAKDCDQALRQRGVIVRNVASYGLPHCLRITVGAEDDCRLVADTVAQFMVSQ